MNTEKGLKHRNLTNETTNFNGALLNLSKQAVGWQQLAAEHQPLAQNPKRTGASFFCLKKKNRHINCQLVTIGTE